MKKSFILFLIIFLVFFSSYPAQAGYWKLSGDGVVEKSIVSEGSQTVTLYSSDSNHIDVSVEWLGNQWPMVRAEFRWDTPPQIIRKGEVIPVSVSYSFKSAAQQGGCGVGLSSPYQGLVTLILFDVNSNNPIPPTGQIINTQNRAPNGPESDVFIKYTCGLNGGSGQTVSFPYKWVEDETPTTPVSQPSTNSKTLAAGETWNVGEGYTLTANAIDAKAGQIWLILSKNGKQVYDSTVNVGETYTYNNIKIKVVKTTAGAVSDSVTLTDISGASTSPGITPRVSPGITPDKGTTTVTAKRTTPKPGATTPQETTGDFTVSISPTEMTVNPGENIRFTLTVEPEGDFNEPVEVYVKTEALGIEKDYGRVKIINPPYKPYVFEKQVPDSIPKGTTITGYVTAKGGGLERDAGTVTVNVPGFGTLLAIVALGLVTLLRKRR